MNKTQHATVALLMDIPFYSLKYKDKKIILFIILHLLSEYIIVQIYHSLV